MLGQEYWKMTWQILWRSRDVEDETRGRCLYRIGLVHEVAKNNQLAVPPAIAACNLLPNENSIQELL